MSTNNSYSFKQVSEDQSPALTSLEQRMKDYIRNERNRQAVYSGVLLSALVSDVCLVVGVTLSCVFHFTFSIVLKKTNTCKSNSFYLHIHQPLLKIHTLTKPHSIHTVTKEPNLQVAPKEKLQRRVRPVEARFRRVPIPCANWTRRKRRKQRRSTSTSS